MVSGTFLPPVQLNRSCLLTLFLTCTLGTGSASLRAQMHAQEAPTAIQLRDRITHNQEAIQTVESQALPHAKLGVLWARLALDYREAADFPRSEDAYHRSIQLLKDTPESRADYATVLANLGSLYLIYGHLEEAALLAKQALAIRQELGDEVNIAFSRQHLADLDLARHKFKEAEIEASHAYEILSTAEKTNKAALIASLISLTYSRCELNKCSQGVQDAQLAIDTVSSSFPPDSIQVGHAFMAMGFAQWKSGENQQAEQNMLHAIRVIKTQSPAGDPFLLYSLMQYRAFLKAMHRIPESKQVDLELASFRHQVCANCTVGISTLSGSMR
jgi:tetratricopeptide (TPR) repeat protein